MSKGLTNGDPLLRIKVKQLANEIQEPCVDHIARRYDVLNGTDDIYEYASSKGILTGVLTASARVAFTSFLL